MTETGLSSPSIGSIAKALAAAQGEFGAVTRNREVTVATKTGGSYKFAYATLDEVLSATRPALARHGVAFVQVLHGDRLRTMLLHAESGEWIASDVQMPARQGSPQEFGSALTYLRRYSLVSLLGVAAEEDDDGNAAEGNTIQASQTRGKPAPAPEKPTPRRQKVDPGAASTVRRALAKLLGEVPQRDGPERTAMQLKWSRFVDEVCGRAVDGPTDLYEDEVEKVLASIDAKAAAPKA